MKPTTEQLAEALDTACNLLALSGPVQTMKGTWVCDNCGCDELIPDDFGRPDNHSADCDMPLPFAIRDEYQRAQERAKLAEEVGR